MSETGIAWPSDLNKFVQVDKATREKHNNTVLFIEDSACTALFVCVWARASCVGVGSQFIRNYGIKVQAMSTSLFGCVQRHSLRFASSMDAFLVTSRQARS